MEDLIPIINKLQDIVSSVETSPLDLPQIVVVGSQSSGKSSVLETIVGKDFLPRGSDIVTRRPLVLQLNTIAGQEEYGEFYHAKGKKFYDFKKIREEIERVTTEETGSNKGISSKPINLKIFSPHVVNLTLVDLPGITKVPVGDQPIDIEIQIKNMIMQYINNPNAIILAVTPANTDLANSDALKLSREVDPQGIRTIGVLTKIDLMDQGTDCLQILQGSVYTLRFGFVAVVNRSQKDVIEETPIDVARRKEKEFFQSHPVYSQISNRCGFGFLTSKLSKILINHIRECLPELRSRVNKLLSETRERLNIIGDSHVEQNKAALLLSILNSFTNAFSSTIDGSLSDAKATVELYGGARINYVFNDVFGRYLDTIDSKGGLTTQEIQLTISNSTGTKSSLFIPEDSFEQLAKRQIKLLEEPAIKCVDLVFEELKRIVNTIEINELGRFKQLKEKLLEVVNELLKSCKKPTKNMIRGLIQIELSYINTNHPDFIGGGDAIAKILQKRAQRNMNQPKVNPELERQREKEERDKRERQERERRDREERERQRKEREKQKNQKTSFFDSWFGGNQPKNQPDNEPSNNNSSRNNSNDNIEIINSPGLKKVPNLVVPENKDLDENTKFQIELLELLLKSYFNIVKKNFKDKVPKSIMYFLVNRSKSEMQNELVKTLYKEELFEKLLEERDDIAKQRGELQERIRILSDAHKILSDIFDLRV